MYNKKAVRKLQQALLKTSQLSILQPDASRQLSIAIFTQNKEYISETTIKQIFGQLSQLSEPPLVIMNMLSRYAGFDSWQSLEQSILRNYPDQSQPFTGTP